MTTAKEILSPNDYRNYRNVRAVATFFILLGSILALGGIILTVDPDAKKEGIHPAISIVMAAAGLAGAVGGIAALRGSRRWAPLVYLMAALYVFGFPLGTILSCVMFMGLPKYLDSAELVRGSPAP